MILKAAIEHYLNRPLDDHRWMKDLEDEEVDRALRRLAFKNFPGSRIHQKVGNLLGVAHPQFAYFYDMGTGKTLMSLDLLRYWLELGKLRRAIIFLTSDKAMSTWTRQAQKFGFGDIPYKCLTGSSEEKWDLSRDIKEGFLFVSYPGAVNMVALKSPGDSWELSASKVDNLTHHVDAMVMDESTRAGHDSSLTHLLCKYIAHNKVKFTYGLAGRPFGRDPHMLFSQMNIIDGGDTFGRLALFRAAFFSSKSNYHAKKRGGNKGRFVKDFTFLRRSLPDLRRVMQHRSLQYAAEECIQMPPVNNYIEEVSLPPEAIPYYEEEAERLRANRTNLRVVQNVFLRMRQLSSGFLGFVDDSNNERIELEFEENPKEDRLLDLLEELPENRKALVFYEFTRSGKKISQRLKKLKIDHIWLWSGTKNADAEQNRFMDNDECQVCLVNNKVGSYSLDGLQVANYQFFYESPVGVLEREQAERRVEREGQRYKIFRYDLVTRFTMDERILELHEEGKDMAQVLKQNPVSLLHQRWR